MYDFKQLSPADFEDLTRDLLQEEWGVRLETFRTGPDSGVDLRYSEAGGGTVVQCKHFASSGAAKLLDHLKRDEAAKVTRLAPARYVLVTSAALSPKNKADIRTALHPYIVADGDVVGADDLNNLLTRHPRVEESNFKLWLSSTAVLQRVLHNAEALQAEFEVERIRRKLPLYVQSSAYPAAVDILKREHVVVISGVPGIGKTTLAEMLLFSHLEQGYEPVVIKSEIAEAKRLFNRTRKQIFYYDDFLGQTFLGHRPDFLGRREDAAILDFIQLVAGSGSAKFVLTTREHLLRRAYAVSERFRRESLTFADRSCVLELGHYGMLERGRILYNHIYFSDLPRGHRRQLLADDFYLDILRHRNFNPRLIEWLSRFQNVRSTSPEAYRETVSGVLDQPAQLWRHAFEQEVSEASRSMLLALYAQAGSATLDHVLIPAWSTLHRYRAARYGFATTAEDCRTALQELEGGFLTLGDGKASFVNPSVKDFLDETLCTHQDHALDLLASTECFQTIRGVWALAASEKGGDLRRRFSENPQLLREAVERVLHVPATRTVDGPRGFPVAVTIDATPESRLLAIGEMAGTLRSLRLRDLAEHYAHHIPDAWDSRQLEYDSLTALLAEVDGQESTVWDRSPIGSAVRGLLLRSLIREPYWLEGFHKLAEYAEENDGRFSTQEVASLIGPFERYLSDHLRDDLNNADTESELDDIGSEIQAVGDWLGFNVEAALQDIGERLAELEEKEEAQGGSVRNWISPRSVGRVEAEPELRRLFSGLSEP